MSIEFSLKIKYGLREEPSKDKVVRWADETERMRSAGVTLEEAGRSAASKVFADFGTIFYKSQGDTILALLAEAKKRK